MGRINRRGRQEKPATVRIFIDQYSEDNHVYYKVLWNKSLVVLSSPPSPLSE
jgi:hypothetical protein